MAIGPQFLQTPGPSNVPSRVLTAIAGPTIDHRGPAFAELTSELLPRRSRHARLAAATRVAVSAWGLQTVCADPDAHSDSVTGVLVPEGFPAEQLNPIALDGYNLVLGMGLGRLADRAFRIGHLGYLNEAALLAVLGATELALGDAGIPPRSSGVSAALEVLR